MKMLFHTASRNYSVCFGLKDGNKRTKKIKLTFLYFSLLRDPLSKCLKLDSFHD